MFYASTKMIEAFNIQALPSVVRRSGTYMEVTEVRIPPAKVGGTGEQIVMEGELMAGNLKEEALPMQRDRRPIDARKCERS